MIPAGKGHCFQSHMVMLLHWPAVQSSCCACLTVQGDNVLGHTPGVLAAAQAGRKQSSDIIKSSGSAVVLLQNTHSPLGWVQGAVSFLGVDYITPYWSPLEINLPS